MNRAAITRSALVVVALTLATYAWLIHGGLRAGRADLAAALDAARPAWLAVACLSALQEGVFGGLRIFLLGRVLSPRLGLRAAIRSEFVLMFCAGVTPGQVGAPVAQIAVLIDSGMAFPDAVAAELMTGLCTILFFLGAAAVLFVLRLQGRLAVPGIASLDWLLGLSLVAFTATLLAIAACAVKPALPRALLSLFERSVGRLWRSGLEKLAHTERLGAYARRRIERSGALRARLESSIDEINAAFARYARRGKLALGLAWIVTVGFFCARFAVAYFILLGLGLPTAPAAAVTVGPPIVQVVLVQALLNFALYLSPTPAASGIAEIGSNALMSPWVPAASTLPYLVLWRLIALFLCMFVGGIYVFMSLGAHLLARQIAQAREALRHR